MCSQYLTRMQEPQVPPYPAADMAQGSYAALAGFLAPLLMELDARIDKRLVRTFVQTVAIILTFRDRVGGTHPAVSLAPSDQALDCLEKRRAGCGFPSGMRVRGRSRKALCPKSLARCVRAKPPDSRASRRATTARRVVPFSCRGCIGWR